MNHQSNPHRILHTMLRVRDLDRAIAFYTVRLGMRLLRRQDFEDGQFTLAFLGYDAEEHGTVLELTHNWDGRAYDAGTAYGHLALAVRDIHQVCRRLEAAGVPILRAPGSMKFDSNEHIAFIEDPDGYAIELIERE